MKKIILPILIAGLLTSCGPTSNPTTDPTVNPTVDPTVEPTVDPTTDPSEDPTTGPSIGNHDITIEIPTDLGVDLTNLIDAKKGQKGDYFYVYGIVSQFTYGYSSGGSGHAKVGFYLVDNTSSMYIYCGSGLDNVKIGDAVLVNGSIDYFISQQEAGAGAEIGYLGAQQIKADNVEVINNKYTEIPDAGIERKTIKELATTDFRKNDLSGTIFRVNATVTHTEVSGTEVYYFNDPSMDYSLYTYSTISGAEFGWLSQYVGTTFEWTIAVHSLRSRDEAWRIIPIESFLEVEISDADVAGYALDRLEKQFADSYNSTTSIQLLENDEKLADATVTYSTNSSDHSISTTNEGTFLNIDASKLGSFDVTITLGYKGETYTRTKSIEVIEKAKFDGVTIAEAKEAAENTVVKIKGIYLRTAANVTGIYIADDTGIMAVYYVASFNPEDYLIGEELVFEGTVVNDFTNNGTHPGYKRLSNATLISNDSTVHDWNKKLVAGEKTIGELLDGSDDLVGNLYKVEGKVIDYVSAYFTNKRLVSPDDSAYINLYCGNASQIAWLVPYQDVVRTCYVFVRDKKNQNARVEILAFEE